MKTTIEIYANIIFNRFEGSFRKKHLKADIWYANDIVGILFKVVYDSQDKQLIQWREKKNLQVLDKFLPLNNRNKIEHLFDEDRIETFTKSSKGFAKAIRGFLPKSFYILKLKKRGLWTVEKGHNDAALFMHAILIAAKKNYGERK